MQTYGLIGFPLGHSFSKPYFTEKFLREGRNAQYLNFELDDIGRLPGLLEEHPDLAGFNVTIPYKRQIIPYMDLLDRIAAGAEAVNTVRVVRRGGRPFLEGFNTDVHGFWASLSPLLGPEHRGALVLGSGGASAAVVFALKEAGLKSLLVSRKPSLPGMISYSGITPRIMEEYTLIINTTPLGTFPREETFPPIPYERITPRHLLFDLVYNPAETLFLARGRQQGALVKNGYEMLLLQAEKAWEIWSSPGTCMP
ncbi:MAG: shikimate dehydrogenase [Prolixibacteraceae bacterium]|nr:shikimate dehydrogenase [Prolixibacteraceae bacterium]NLX27662.1 shikimate dehydrogenase [Bacteroidales bacterium]HNQ37847.1 shikimate dehydrogenase [Prolixibacteraceae bacterium]HPJ79255.1 shikimate dehydrogenase [Prolixibacteraceae bacterium]HRV89484.1 shikimate dehydrogenase [Prolixibacteraceae bacterium]